MRSGLGETNVNLAFARLKCYNRRYRHDGKRASRRSRLSRGGGERLPDSKIKRGVEDKRNIILWMM